MDRIALIEGFDAEKVRETLNVMLRDKGHEFQELTKTLNIPETTDDWQVIVLKFCLDFEDCLKIWTDSEEPNSIKNTKCMTIMREIAKDEKISQKSSTCKMWLKLYSQNFMRHIRE